MEEQDKSIITGEAYVEAENRQSPDKNDNHRCDNCATPLSDKYCAHCGQRNIPKRQTLGELLVNFISSFWSFESKFFKTVQYLLFRPGFLASEYNNGKRERYFHPARMYVFISFVYFLLFASLSTNDDADANELTNDKSNKSELSTGAVFGLDSMEYKSHKQYDSIQSTLPEQEQDGWLKRKFKYRALELDQKYKGRSQEFYNDFESAFLNNFSKVFFWLLPIFALILKALYIRRDFFYSEHLVFSIYYYNFFFLAGSVFMLLNQFDILHWLTTIIAIGIAIYLLIGMKKMYKQSWRKTIFKYIMFCICFSFCIALGMAINLITILMFI